MLKHFYTNYRSFEKMPLWVWETPPGEIPSGSESAETTVQAEETEAPIDGCKDTAEAKCQAGERADKTKGKGVKEVDKPEKVLDQDPKAAPREKDPEKKGDDADSKDAEAGKDEDPEVEKSESNEEGGDSSGDEGGEKGAESAPEEAESSDTEDSNLDKYKKMEDEEVWHFAINNFFRSSLKAPLLSIMIPGDGEAQVERRNRIAGDLDLFKEYVKENDQIKKVFQTFANKLTPQQMASMERGAMTQEIADAFMESMVEAYGLDELDPVDEQEVKWLNALPKVKVEGALAKKSLDDLFPGLPEILSRMYTFDQDESGQLRIKVKNEDEPEGAGGEKDGETGEDDSPFKPINNIVELIEYAPKHIRNQCSAVLEGTMDVDGDEFKHLQDQIAKHGQFLDDFGNIQQQLKDIDRGSKSSEDLGKKASFFMLLIKILGEAWSNLDSETAQMAIDDFTAGRKPGSTAESIKSDYAEALAKPPPPDFYTLAKISENPNDFEQEYPGKCRSKLAEAAREKMPEYLDGMISIGEINLTGDSVKVTGEYQDDEGEIKVLGIILSKKPNGSYLFSAHIIENGQKKPYRPPVPLLSANAHQISAALSGNASVLSDEEDLENLEDLGPPPEEENLETLKKKADEAKKRNIAARAAHVKAREEGSKDLSQKKQEHVDAWHAWKEAIENLKQAEEAAKEAEAQASKETPDEPDDDKAA